MELIKRIREGVEQFFDFNTNIWRKAFTVPFNYIGYSQNVPVNAKGYTEGSIVFVTSINEFVIRGRKRDNSSAEWIKTDGSLHWTTRSGSTNDRPNVTGIYVGFNYFDTTLNKPIWWSGSNWVDATGATV